MIVVRVLRSLGVTSLAMTAVVAVTLGAVPADASAQRSGLERVEELTRLGRPEEARALLTRWWEGDRAEASRRELQRGLWLRARLTVDPVQAELDFQRLVVLYPRGPFTAPAILRLAQSAHEMGDGDAARAYVETLVRDYPRSEAREEGEAWLASAGPPPPPVDASARLAARPRGGEPAAADSAAAARTEPERTRPADAPADPAPAERQGAYSVQLGAFSEDERAQALYDEVRAAGIDVRLVRVEGSRFLHVRFGRFVERADAVAELERLTELGISAALVRDERAERPVGR